MGQVGQRPPIGRSTRLELGRRDEQGGDDTTGDQENAHDHSGSGEQISCATDPADWMLRSVIWAAIDVRHHRDAGLEARETECQFGEDQ
jgi:hypothetical protein